MTPNPAEVTAGGPTRVGIGLIRRGARFLIRRRPEGSAMAGRWEFPGGKCEPGESPEDAARRECREETGVDVILTGLRRVAEHRYPHGHIELSYYDGSTREPAAEPAAGTGFRWVAAAELPGLRFPEANGPVLAALAEEFGVEIREWAADAGQPQ